MPATPRSRYDQQYTDQIHKYTTDPSFLSPLVEYLPSSKTVPTPAKVLGDVLARPRRRRTPRMCTSTSACLKLQARA